MTAIYESPDFGKTIYSREPGSTKRTLVSKSRNNTWQTILNSYDWDSLAKQHSSIQNTLEQLKILAELCKK